MASLFCILALTSASFRIASAGGLLLEKNRGARGPIVKKNQAAAEKKTTNSADVLNDGQHGGALSQEGPVSEEGIASNPAIVKVRQETLAGMLRKSREDQMNKMTAHAIVTRSRNVLSRRETELLIRNSAGLISDVEADSIIKQYLGRKVSESEAQGIMSEVLTELEQRDQQVIAQKSEDLMSKITARRIVSQSQNSLSRSEAQYLMMHSADMISEQDAKVIIKHYLGRELSEREARKIIKEILGLLEQRDEQRMAQYLQNLINNMAAQGHGVVRRSRTILSRPRAERVLVLPAHELSDMPAFFESALTAFPG